jgi:hypothetical protein
MDSDWTSIIVFSKMSHALWSETMRRPGRNHSSDFKAKVALAVIQGDLTMSELEGTVHRNTHFPKDRNPISWAEFPKDTLSISRGGYRPWRMNALLLLKGDRTSQSGPRKSGIS